ncbi:DUF58 domain-containing protein [uncultured Vibrio sp.]|uniref:DUF58 domain-containing protein n=1 Tax=uncultured Vibrio sp. TaxID=114054 RepID=UPI0025FB539A|nr:DUF58 domain-containing protein [uncultured Vibrio sp.]
MKTKSDIYVDLDELLKLQHRARHIGSSISSVTQNMLQGNRPSKVHGRGGAFDQIRDYIAGDDVRNIDWNVTARMGKPSVRVFNEERETPVLLLIDQSSSLFFATKKQMKSVVSAKVAAYLLWMAFNHKRPCGGVIVDDETTSLFRPRTHQSHVHHFLCQLVESNQRLSNISRPNHSHGFVEGLRQLNRIVSKDSIVVLISDFVGMNNESWSLIEQLRIKTNLVATPIYDGVIKDLPNEGQFLARYTDIQAELDFSTSMSRDQVVKGSQGRLQDLIQKFSELAIPVLRFSTYQSVEEQLISGLYIDGGPHD